MLGVSIARNGAFALQRRDDLIGQSGRVFYGRLTSSPRTIVGRASVCKRPYFLGFLDPLRKRHVRSAANQLKSVFHGEFGERGFQVPFELAIPSQGEFAQRFVKPLDRLLSR